MAHTIQVNSELEKRLVFNIIQYLKSFTIGGSESDLHVDTEGLEVAVQCISAAFSLDPNSQELAAQYSVEPLSLPHIFGLGLAGKQQLEEYAKSQLVQEPDAPQQKVPEELKEKFKAFVNVLEKKDFFKGTEPGSQEYQQRYALAEEKFLARQTPSSAPTQPAAVPPQPDLDPKTIEEAERFKTQGNEHLSSKRVEEAIECYSTAIKLNPNNPVYFANRAAAYSQLGNHENAIFDCKSALDLDPKYSKAYSRLGFSLFSLGKYKEAIELGYKKCLELDPGNTGAKDAMLLSQEKLEEQERAKEKKQTTPAPSAGTGLPAAVPPGFEQLLSSPDIQESMQNLAQQFPGLAGAGNQGGGGQPSLGDLLNNPALMNMAQQVMSSPAFGQMLQNPAFMNMAQGMMQNPGEFEAMFKGMGGNQKKEGDK